MSTTTTEITETTWGNVSYVFQALQIFGGINAIQNIKIKSPETWVVKTYCYANHNYGYLLSDGKIIIKFYDNYQFLLFIDKDKFYIVDNQNNKKASFLLSNYEHYSKGIKNRIDISNFIKNKLIEMQCNFPRPFNRKFLSKLNPIILRDSTTIDSSISIDSDVSCEASESLSNVVYLVNSITYDNFKVHNLSNGITQATYKDGVDIIFSDNGRIVSIIDLNGDKITFPLFSLIERPIDPMLTDRLQILINKCLTNLHKPNIDITFTN